MQIHQIQLTDVIYNAGTQSFEALVTIIEGERFCKYACAIDAPISMSFEDAAKGLSRQATRRHGGRGGIFSETRREGAPQRAGRPRFDPKEWLANIIKLPGRNAA